MQVIIDYGHVENDSGAVANGFREDNLNKSIGGYAVLELQRHGVDVVITTGTLAHRVEVEHKIRPDLFVSIHNNAGGGDGTEVYTTGSTKGTILATNILNSIINDKLNNSRGVKKANYYVIKNTIAPAALVECAFMDTKDIQAVDTEEKRKAFGVAIAKGILKTLGVAYKPVVVTPKPTEEKAPTGQYYRVQVGAYTNKKYAEEELAKLKKAGFEGIIKLY